MWTSRFWKQVAERTITGAAAGALGGVAALVVTDVTYWTALGSSAVVGGLTAFCASIAGTASGDPNTPLLTAPSKEDQ